MIRRSQEALTRDLRRPAAAGLKDSGDLAGRPSWSKGSRVTIPKTQDYGAHFYVGTVAVTVNGQAGTCSTIGPRGDNVYLDK